MDARHASAALSMRPTKSDRSDARGLAEMLRMGWYRSVAAKSFTSHERLALLAARHHLVEIRVDLDGQIRGLLKTFGLILGPGNTDALIRRAEALVEGNPTISGLVAKLAEVRRHVVAQIAALDLRRLVRSEPVLKRLMAVPGVGPIPPLAFPSPLHDPERFKPARDVGPYLGLTPTRYQSGETDRHGRISKCGDTFTRTCLYEAAHVLLTRVQRFSPLKAWGEADRRQKGAHRSRSQDCRHPALHLDRRYRVLVDAREGSLTHDPPHQLRAGGGAVLAGTVGEDDRAEAVDRMGICPVRSLSTSRRHTPDTHHGAGNRPRREP